MARARTKAVIATAAIVIIMAIVATFVMKTFSSYERARRRKPMDVRQFEKNPGYRVLNDAVSFIHQLRINGQLPGFSEDEQCLVRLPRAPANTNIFPYVLQYDAKKQNVAGPWTYHFSVVKASATNDWQLRRAWRTDDNGKVIEEYSVPTS